MKCEYCSSELKELFTSTYCPNDCDKKSSLSNIDWGKALLELRAIIDSWKSFPNENSIIWTMEQLPGIGFVNPSSIASMIWPWFDTEE